LDAIDGKLIIDIKPVMKEFLLKDYQTAKLGNKTNGELLGIIFYDCDKRGQPMNMPAYVNKKGHMKEMVPCLTGKSVLKIANG
jgi:hypothetical protein